MGEHNSGTEWVVRDRQCTLFFELKALIIWHTKKWGFGWQELKLNGYLKLANTQFV